MQSERSLVGGLPGNGFTLPKGRRIDRYQQYQKAVEAFE